MPARTCCGIAAPPTWWRTGRTCARYKLSLDTPTSPPARYIRMWRWTGSGRFTVSFIHGEKEKIHHGDTETRRELKIVSSGHRKRNVKGNSKPYRRGR